MNICVVGASQGLGRALSETLSGEGHTIWGIARSAEKLASLEKKLPKGAFRWSPADVTNDDTLSAWLRAMHDERFQPDCVVLCASIQLNDMEEGYDHASGRLVLDTNLGGSLKCVALLLPEFLRRGKGMFVVITSTVVHRPSIRSASYAASKAGISMAFRTLDLRYRSKGVAFKRVCLGPIATEMWEGKRSALVPGPDAAAKAIARFIHTHRSVLYYPFLTTALLRMIQFLPDRTFALLSSTFLK